MVEHSYLDHTFKYPGRVTWDNITLTLIDPVDPDLAYEFLQRLGVSGYRYPTTQQGAKSSLSKKKASEAIGRIQIQQLDDEGDPIETWTLINPFMVSIDFGGQLDYTSDEMNEISLELAFDWAELRTKGRTAGPPAIR